MHIYFYSKHILQDSLVYGKIFLFSKTKGFQLIINQTPGDPRILTMQVERLNELKIDAIIVEDPQETVDFVYLIARALTGHIPLLYLIPRYQLGSRYLDFLIQYKQKRPWVRVVHFKNEMLPRMLIKFIEDVRAGRFDKPCVKFTLVYSNSKCINATNFPQDEPNFGSEQTRY